MSTLPQDEKQSTISFRCPEGFKRTLDIELAKRGVTSQDFCTRSIAAALGIPVPGEQPEPVTEKQRKRA